MFHVRIAVSARLATPIMRALGRGAVNIILLPISVD